MNNYRSSRYPTAALAGFLALLAVIPFALRAEDNLLNKSIDAVFNLRDQLQDVVMKSVKGVGEAMQEGPPPDNIKPFSLEDLKQLQQKNVKLRDANQTLANAQQALLNLDVKLLAQLPPNHPRRAEIAAEIKQVGGQIPATRASEKHYAGKVSEANAAVKAWKQRHPEDAKPKKEDLAKLKNVEKNLQRLVNELTKVREAAVAEYIKDPTATNRAHAEDIKKQLVSLVNRLNEVRRQVDGLEGTSRPEIGIRTAREIASSMGREAGRGATRENVPKPPKPEGHHHGPGGGDR